MFDVGDRIIGLELPDTFYKLAELLEQDQFELLLSKNRIKDMHRKQDISLVYLMNDAVESFRLSGRDGDANLRRMYPLPAETGRGGRSGYGGNGLSA